MANSLQDKIDFVMTWVDGDDPVWKTRKEENYHRFKPACLGRKDDNGDNRYQDNGLLRYWFRSVEKYAPWVNKVFFVTCGQKPDWLNENHPKLVLIDHQEFIPSAYLPTFNSNTIEVNLHRIKDLSEQFVLFNDDLFLLRPISPEFFFKEREPVLSPSLHICRTYGNNYWSRMCFNCFCTINEHIDIVQEIWNNRGKWFDCSALGPGLALKNIIRYKINKTISISSNEHLACPHLKSTLQEVWEECPDVMEETSMSRFRSDTQISHWLMISWNMVKGRFFPIREGVRGRNFNDFVEEIETICDIIEHQSEPQICINDVDSNINRERCLRQISQALDTVLPERSSFEL